MSESKSTKNPFGRGDALVLVGMCCLTAGAWSVIGLASLILPGSLLVWYALPPRPPFVQRQER